jgi:6-phosphogluconolactonase (cycloisomerase 2 family)
MKPFQTFQFTLAKPGADPVYETAPHPHEALLDPSGNFILIPDLGADLIRLYHINSCTKLLEPLEPFQVPIGSGPRHAAFLVAKSGTYFYVVSQLTNILTAYVVKYNRNETLSFMSLFAQSLLKTGTDTDLQPYSAAAEIHITVCKFPQLLLQSHHTHDHRF